MATIRPGRCYRELKRPFCRHSKKKPKKNFVGGVPVSKIHQFEMGDNKKVFPVALHLVSKDAVQIRSNALEAARMAATKNLAKAFGEMGFFLKIRVYPHHVLRENAMATGAGADRFSQGMRHNYGISVGQAAQVRVGQKLMTAKVANKNDIDKAKLALRRAGMKLPLQWHIEIEDDNKLIDAI